MSVLRHPFRAARRGRCLDCGNPAGGHYSPAVLLRDTPEDRERLGAKLREVGYIVEEYDLDTILAALRAQP